MITEWKHGPHQLTCRQAEYTLGLIADVLGKQKPDGLPSQALQEACDDLLEASIPAQHKDASRPLAVDWTDLESFSRPPPHGTSDCADPETSWGHHCSPPAPLELPARAQGISDGAHYGPTFSAKVCKSPSDKTDVCPASDQSPIKVQYKVCIDVPIESYKAAKANISSSRWIPTFFSEMNTKPNWTVWKKPAAPSAFLDGDIVAADNAQHGHAGIVDTGLVDWVINLPGPTASRKFGLFKPSG